MKPCRQCVEPAWSDGLCMTCLQERARAITVERKRVAREVRRREFFLASRAARLAGDAQLWHELRHRRRHNRSIPKDISAAAFWRRKWVEAGASGAPASANAQALPHGHDSESRNHSHRRGA